MRDKKITLAALAILTSCASWSFATVPVGGTAPSQPIKVEIVRAPENRSDFELVFATWTLAIVTSALCVITGVGMRTQGKDMKRFVKVAEAHADAASRSATATIGALEAAARQRRDEIERAVNSAAHRVIATASHVDQLAKEVPGVAKTLLGLAGRRPLAELASPYERKMELRQKAVAEEITAAGILLGTLEGRPPDSELSAGLRDIDRRLVHVELMKEDVTRELDSLNSQIEFQRQTNEERLRAAGGRIPPPIPGA